jgi:hypothetical protein
MHNQSSQLDKTRQPTANLTCNRAGGSYAQPLHWDSFHSNRVCLPWDFAPSRPDERLLHGHKLSVSFGLHGPTLEQHLTTLFSNNYMRSKSHGVEPTRFLFRNARSGTEGQLSPAVFGQPASPRSAYRFPRTKPSSRTLKFGSWAQFDFHLQEKSNLSETYLRIRKRRAGTRRLQK